MAEQVPQEASKDSLSALAAALKLAQETCLVTPKENEAKVNSALKDAKKLLKQLRGNTSEDEEEVVEEVKEEPAVQSFGMGPRAFASNANITPDEQRQIDLATEQFKQSVQRVDSQVLAMYVQAVQNGSYAEAEAILEKAVASQQTNTLMFALLTIGAILLPLYAKQRLVALFRQFGLHTVFAATKDNQNVLRLQAERGAKSHIRTIAKDIKNSLDDAIADEINSPEIEASIKDKYEELTPLEGKEFKAAVVDNQAIYKFARDLIMAGESRQSVIKKLQENFAHIGTRRANVIAGNEANRVFTMSQFDADQQFLAQNQLTPKAYKRLVSNTGNPEAICAYIIRKTAEQPIPFTQDFVPFGKTITVKENGKTYKFKAGYEKLQSGHIHVNCHCRYELLILQDDGTFFNTYDGKTLNAANFDESKVKRDGEGKFATKASTHSGETRADLIAEAKDHPNVQSFKDAVHKRREYGTLVPDMTVDDSFSDPQSLKEEVRAGDVEDGLYEGGDDYLYEVKDGKLKLLKEYRAFYNWDSGEFEIHKRTPAPEDIRGVPIYHNTEAKGLKATDLDVTRSGQNFGGVGGNEFDAIYFTTHSMGTTFGSNKVEGKLSMDARVVTIDTLLVEYQAAQTTKADDDDADYEGLNEFAIRNYDVVDKKDEAGESWELAVVNPSVIEEPTNNLDEVYAEAHGKDKNNFDEDKVKRDKDGKFAKKEGRSNSIDLSGVSKVKDFNETIEKAYWDGSLGNHDEETTDSVRAYQGHFYDAINIHARSQELDSPIMVYSVESTYGGLIDNINNAANVTLATDTTLYRGVHLPLHQNIDEGETIHSRSFLSTSVDTKVAEGFKPKGGSMIVISAKKGQKVVLPDYVTYGKRGRTMGEAEVLMPTNSVLTITKIDGDIVYADLN